MNALTELYGAAVGLRNTLFDRRSVRIARLEKPVISVGNLSMGGAGKTPFVIALGELLKQRDIPFDVLSRGYGRKSRGVFVVDPEGAARDFADEPLLIARRLGIPVVVGESRYHAGLLAEQKFPSRLHLLDDGFQHRGLHRDFDIVMLTVADFDDHLLPSGRLREPMSALGRADAVVLPQGVVMDRPVLRGKPIWHVKREIVLPQVPASPVAFCGIARPEQFFAQLHVAGITPAAEVTYRDHHAYTARDVDRLLAMCRDKRAGGFVTTEKDAINLGPRQQRLEALSVVRLQVAIDRPDDLVNTIVQRIATREPLS